MQSYFDPKTGELIGGELDTPTQPQSGQPDFQQSQQYDYNMNQQQSYQQNYQQPQQPQPPQNNGKNKKILLGAGIGCGAVAVIAVIVFVVSQLLLSNPVAKISLAAVNTLKGGQLTELFNPKGIINKDGMSVDVSLDADDIKAGASVAYQQSKSRKAVSGKLDMEIFDEELALEGTVELDKDRIALNIPQLDDTIYTYYYTGENDGFLIDLLDDVDDDILDMVNEALTKAYELGYEKESDEVSKALLELVMAELEEMDMEELDKEEFEVNGKKVKCGGYLVTVTEDNLLHVLEGLADVYADYYADALDDMLDELDMDMDDLFDELEDELEDEFEDIELSFYLYKEQFACVKAEVDDSIVSVYFHGGDYPAQNMEVILEYDDEEYNLCMLEGSVKNQVETLTLEIADTKICEINYNQKTGEVEIDGGKYLDFELSGVVTRKGNTLTVELDDLEIDGMDVTGSFTISGDADIKLPEGEEFDLGNASKHDLLDLVEDLEDEFEDILDIAYYY